MPSVHEVLDREFLDTRAKILALAATFDRIEGAEGNRDDDPRARQLTEALALVGESIPNRAEQVLLHFSLPYNAAWQDVLDS